MFGLYRMSNFEKVDAFNRESGKKVTGFKNPVAINEQMGLISEEYKELMNYTSRENLIKEATDLLYVTYGLFSVLGINADDVFAEVHRSNMSKQVDGVFLKNEHNKVIKGPFYKPANMSQFTKRS